MPPPEAFEHYSVERPLPELKDLDNYNKIYPFTDLLNLPPASLITRLNSIQVNENATGGIPKVDFTKFVLSDLFSHFGVTDANYQKCPLFFFFH